MRTVAIIQARVGSTRLPNKVMEIISGKTVLSHVISRVKACALLDVIVIATTILPADDVIVTEAEKCGVKWFRGSEDDVLSRYYFAAQKYNAELVVRITSDCPLFDPHLLTEMLEHFNAETSKGKRVDYLSNTLIRTYPRGLDAEVFTFGTIEKAHLNATKPYEREHVTPYIYQHPEMFSIHTKTSEKNFSNYRWTLDTYDDLKFIEEIYSVLYEDNELFTTAQILHLLKQRTELALLNAHVEQKKMY